MAPRLRFVVTSLLFALVGAGLELASLLLERPWPAPVARRALVETTLLWLAVTLAFALLLVATSLRRRPRAAFAVAPLAFGVAWLLVRLDPLGRLPVPLIGTVGGLALLGAFVAAKLAARACGRLPERGAVGLATALVVAVALADLLAWRRSGLEVAAPPATPTPNLLLISIDTLRADRVGFCGGTLGLTPSLDSFARRSVVFDDAIAPMPLTAPSHVAMLSGFGPHASGVRRNGVPLAENVAVLPDRLARQGYLTAAFVSGLPLADRLLGLAARFHLYDDELDLRAPLCEPVRGAPFGAVALRLLRSRLHGHEATRRDGRETLARAAAWLEARPRAPFFAFVHLYDLHAPYEPRGAGATPSPLFADPASLSPAARAALLEDPDERRRLVDLYDGGVAWLDAQLGPFLERVRMLGLLERTVVVVTSDHGESLGEHGRFADHVEPYAAEIRVPLLIHLPNGELGGRRVAGPAQLEDLAATLRDLLGVSIAVPGSSLAGALRSGTIASRLRFAASARDRPDGGFTVAVCDDRFKLLREAASFDPRSGRFVRAADRLYDLVADPGETHELSGGGEGPPDLARWRAALDEFEKRIAAEDEAGPDAATREKLGRLGYAR
jgi:arylsulfatase A-like enzyme